MINADQLKDRMRLWTPGKFDEVSVEETSNNLIICGEALSDFFSLKITPAEYLDIVESCGVNVDEYGSSVCVMQWTEVIRDGTLIEKGI